MELLSLLEKDFSIFKVETLPAESSQLNLFIGKSSPAVITIPTMVSRMQSLNSITYQQGPIRYNDYYGKLLSIFDYSKEDAQIFSLDENKAHEVAYLLILSRIGKKLDLCCLHKLHAFAISYRELAFVCMMPMKGGKSTLLMELLKNPQVKMISDDIPLIDKLGRVYPFPIKIGVENRAELELEIKDPERNLYQLNREQYGIKTFICLDGLEDKVERPGKRFEKVIIAEGFRFNSERSEVIKASWFSTFRGLFKHGVVGIGLPMILEYFWEFGVNDFFTKAKIFFYRLSAFFIFSLRSKKIKINLGKKSEIAAAEILKYLEAQL